jgi:hypothetical protein
MKILNKGLKILGSLCFLILISVSCSKQLHGFAYEDFKCSKFVVTNVVQDNFNCTGCSFYLVESVYTKDGSGVFNFWIQDSTFRFKVGDYITLKPIFLSN